MADGCWLAGACLLLAALRTTRTVHGHWPIPPASEAEAAAGSKAAVLVFLCCCCSQSRTHSTHVTIVTDLQAHVKTWHMSQTCSAFSFSALLLSILILASGLFTVHTQQLPATGRTVTLPQK
jgi:hypothetical protein